MVAPIRIEGLEQLHEIARELGKTPEEINRAASRAVNRATAKGRTTAQRQMETEVAFPGGYLNAGAGRLAVTRQSNPSSLEAVITGKGRSTSLARFSRGSPGPGQNGVVVQVAPGKTQRLKRAFLIRLKSGQSETRNNLGLAVRLPVGRKPSAAYRPKELGVGSGLWLLYGPSVDQVLKSMVDGRAGRAPLRGKILRDLEDEFFRQVKL